MPAGTKSPPGPLMREIGRILRARMARYDILQGDLAHQVGMSPSQLSRALRGRSHMDVEQFDRLCASLHVDSFAVLREARDEIMRDRQPIALPSAAPADVTPAAIAARLENLVRVISNSDDAAGYRLAQTHASTAGAVLSRFEWTALRKGTSAFPIQMLRAVSSGFGVDEEYLGSTDEALIKRVEAQLALYEAAATAGVSKLAARGGVMSADTLEAVTELIGAKHLQSQLSKDPRSSGDLH